MMFKKLRRALVLFRRRPRSKRAQISALSGLRASFSRIKPELSQF
jgi:hypothetical protein